MRKSKKISVDKLGRKILSQEINKASSEVDLEVKEAGMVIKFDGIKIGKLEIQFQLRGVQLAAAVLIVGFISIIGQLLNK